MILALPNFHVEEGYIFQEEMAAVACRHCRCDTPLGWSNLPYKFTA